MSGDLTIPRYRPTSGSSSSSSSCCLESGEIVGNTLVLTNEDGSTTNIPLTGIEGAIDFDNLSAIQLAALQNAIKGDLVCDAFNNELGNLI